MKYAFFLILAIMTVPDFLQAQDWPNLARYRDENAQMGPPAAGEQRVVFMGNSITESWMKLDSVFFGSHHYIDRGISGQTTPQMLLRFKQDVIDLQPKVVVILAGTNDIAGNTGPSTLEMIENNLSSMALLAQTAHIEVILSSVLPVFDYPWRPGLQPAEKIVTLNKWIKDFASQHHFYYLDYYSSVVDDRKGMRHDYSEDGVHPNLSGYKVMESLVEKAIAEALGNSSATSSSTAPVMDHTTVFVLELARSTKFYQDVMELPQIAEPFKDGRHSWFQIGPHSQLHVVSGAKAVGDHDINIHLAFRVPSVPVFMKHLDQLGIKYGNWTGEKKVQMRPDGISQIYFQDPDGYWIEVNDDRY